MANLKKRALSLFMAVMMVLTAMPMNALALEWSDILEGAGSIIEGIDDYAVLVCEKKVVEHTEACKIHTESCYHDHTYSVTVPVVGTVSYDCKFNNCTAHTHSTENGCPVGNCTAHVHSDECGYQCGQVAHKHSTSCCNGGRLHFLHTCNTNKCGGQKEHSHSADVCKYACGVVDAHTHSDECYSCETPVHKHGEDCVCQFGLTRKDIDAAKCALNSHDCNDETHHQHSIEQGCYLLGEVFTSAFEKVTGIKIEQPEEIKAVLAALTGCETGCGLDYKVIATEPYLELSLDLCDEHFCTICRRLNDGYCTCVEITFANIGNDPENTKVVKAAKGEAVAADAVPNADMFNYRFLGWFDAEGNEFSTEVVYTEDITFTAQYKALTETEKLENMAQFVKDNFNLGAELGRVISILSKGEITKETIVDKKDEIVNYVTAYLLTSQLTGKMTSEQAAEIVALMDQGDEFVTMLSEWLWTEEDQTIQFDQIISDIDFEKLAEEVKAKITAEYGVEFTQEWVDKNVELLNQYIASVLEEALTEALVEVKDMTEQQMEIVLTQIKNEIEHANFVISLVSAEIVSAVRKEVADVKAFVRELLANRELGIYLGKTVSALSTLNSENVLANGHKLEEVLFKAIRMSALPVAHQDALIAYIDENDGIAVQFVDWLWPQITISWFNGDVFLASEVIASDMEHVFKGETPTKEADAEFTYVFDGWKVIFRDQDEVYYTAVYENVLNSYTVTWENYDGSVLKTETLAYGATPVYTGETPVKEADAQYSYNFTGWEQEITEVTGDVTYTAKFGKTVNEYTVTFMVDGEKIIHTYAYGAMPEIDDPTKAADAQYTYKFAGWDKEIVEVTGDATYTAEFTNILNYYTIKFVGENGVVLQEGTVAYGETPVYSGETPVKEGNAQYSYTFANWDKKIAAVTGNATYTAQFTETVNKYTIKFVNEDGTLLYEQTVAYGTTPVFACATPTKAADAQYTYTFASWSPAIVSVTGDATYTATYSSTVNTYTVTWEDGYGKVLEVDEKVPYGTMPEYNGETPVAQEDPRWVYTFACFNPTVTTVTGDVTYRATYSAVDRFYNVTFMDGDKVIKTVAVKYEAGVSMADAPAATELYKEGHTFVGWNADISRVTENMTVYAVWQINSYTVKFVNEDGTELQSSKVEYGAMPAYTGAEPTKDADAQYTYTFAGWDKAIAAVTGDVTYTATYSGTVNKYTVKFVDKDGTELQSSEVAYGETPVYSGKTPVKAATAQYTYTFAGWDKEIAVVTGDVTYTATYSNTVNKYTIKFVGEDGTLLYEQTVAYGKKPVFACATPTKAADAQYTYTFAGWDKEIAVVTGDVTYTATFTSETNVYTVTFDVDGVKTDKVYAYGEKPEFADPTKEGNAQYSYTFTGWDKEFAAVTGDVTYTAQFKATVNEYTIKFVDEDGTVLETQTVAYGETPAYTGATLTKAADAQYTYTFAGWDKAIAAVAGNATYTATYSGTVNKYTIKFVDEDGTELQSSEVEYGAKPEYTGVTPVKAADAQYTYTFAGWDKAIAAVTGDVTYTATYSGTVNKYTIKFVDEDGTELQSGKVAYGETPVYTGETPVKAADAQYTYTFAGWDTAIATVTGEATYTATYSGTVNKYTIKFVDEDGTELQSSEVEYGAKPEYTGATPFKAATAQYTYKFAGWKNEIVPVTGNATYTATYSSTANEYTIKFVNEDGTELQTLTVAYGKTPAYTAETPVKAATAQYTYSFAGWDKAIAAVTGHATYTATYSATVNEYTIKFVNEDGTVLETQTVAYGKLPVYTGATPFKADTAEFYYDFAGFGEVTTVTGDATYTAVYTATVRTYRVTFKDGDKTLSSVIYAYGAEILAPALPTKNGWDSKWSCEFSTVTGELTVEVVWSYTVFDKHDLLIYVGTGVSGTDSTKDWTKAGKGQIYNARHYDSYDVDGKYVGSTIMTEGVDYKSYTAKLGNVTIKGITYGNETGSNFYVVNEYIVVATDAQYHLDCHATLYHTVTFVDYNGNVIDTVAVERGTAATAPADPTRMGYVFTGWDKAFDNVTNSMTVTAQYEYEIVASAKLKVNVGTGISASGSLKGNGLSHWGTIYNVRSVYSYYDYPNYVGDTIMSNGDFDFERTYNEAVANLKSVEINNIVYTQGKDSSDNYYILNGEYYFVACKGEFHLDLKADFYNVTTFVVGEEVIKVTTARGAQIEMPADPVKDGYEFDGWEIDENGVYNAKFTKIHKVKIVNAPGYNQTLLVRDGETIVLPFNEPTRTGYYCAGWYHYRVQDPKKESFDFSTPVTGDMELSPKWEYSYADRDVTVFAIINGERVELGMGTIENFRHPKTFGYAVVAAKDYKNANFVLPTGEITIDGITYTYGAESGANGYTLTVKNLEVIQVSTGSKYAFECEVEVELYHRVTFNLAVGGNKVFYVRDGEQLDPNWIDDEEDFFSYEVINYWYNSKGGAKLDFDTYVVTQAVSFSCKTKDKYGNWDVALKGTLNGETFELGTAVINDVKHAGCWRNDSANRYNITAYDASQITMPGMQSIVVDGVTYTYGAGSSDNYYTIDFTTLSCYSIRNSRGKVVDWEYHYTGEIELFHDNVAVKVKIVDGGSRTVKLNDVAHGTVIDTAWVAANVNPYLVVEENLIINKAGEYTVTAIYTGP